MEHENVGDEGHSEFRVAVNRSYIQRVHLVNFMRHTDLTVDFSPEKPVTIIKAKNGSGKSAIVAAIQVCFGASPEETGRGPVASLIRHGCSHGIAEVFIVNSTLCIDGAQISCIGFRRVITPDQSKFYVCLDARKNWINVKLRDILHYARLLNVNVTNPLIMLTQNQSTDLISSGPQAMFQFAEKALHLDDVKCNEQKMIEGMSKMVVDGSLACLPQPRNSGLSHSSRVVHGMFENELSLTKQESKACRVARKNFAKRDTDYYHYTMMPRRKPAPTANTSSAQQQQDSQSKEVV